MTIIETMARVMAEVYWRRFLDNDSPLAQPLQEYVDEHWDSFADQARAALRSVKPSDISDEMIEAFVQIVGKSPPVFSYEVHRRAIAAAIAKGGEA